MTQSKQQQGSSDNTQNKYQGNTNKQGSNDQGQKTWQQKYQSGDSGQNYAQTHTNNGAHYTQDTPNQQFVDETINQATAKKTGNSRG